MQYLNKNFLASLQFIVLIFLSANAGAADVADISGEGSEIYWDMKPETHYGSADLRVSQPDGNVSTQNFKNPQTPFYSAREDGRHDYELTLNPQLSKEDKKALKSARLASGGQEASATPGEGGGVSTEPVVQSGSFLILNGTLVQPDIQE